MELDLTNVRSFLAVVRYGGFRRAARVLNLSQPALSRRVARLERQLGGGELLDRHAQRISLTAYGLRVAGELEGMLAAHDRAVLRMAPDATARRPFVLATNDNFVERFLAPMLATFEQVLGGEPIQLRIDDAEQVVEGFDRGEIDAALVFGYRTAPNALDLGTVAIRWYMSEHASLPDPVPNPIPIVAFRPPCLLRDLVDTRARELGVRYEVTSESRYLIGVQAAVRHGLGYALLLDATDGIVPVARGPLREPLHAHLRLLLADPYLGHGPAIATALQRVAAGDDRPRSD